MRELNDTSATGSNYPFNIRTSSSAFAGRKASQQATTPNILGYGWWKYVEFDRSGRHSTDERRVLNAVESVPAGKTWNIYAWTGTPGTSYDNDVHLADASKLDVTTS